MANNSDYKDFLFFDIFLHAAEGLTAEEQNEFFRKMIAYGTSGELVKCSDKIEAIFWPLIPAYFKDKARRDLNRGRKNKQSNNTREKI